MYNCKGTEILTNDELIKVNNYIAKKAKKWHNINAKIQKTVYSDYLLHIKYTENIGIVDNKNWIHDHRILLSKI